MQAVDGAVGRIGEHHVVTAVRFVIGIAVHVVRAHHDVRTAFHQQVMRVALPERVPGDYDAAGMPQMNIHGNVAQGIVGDDEIAHLVHVRGAPPEEADIGRVGRFGAVLHRAAREGAFENRPLSGVEQHVRGGRTLGVLVGFDVARPDLDVPDLAFADDDTAPAVVTDMRAGDIDLVQIQVLEEDAGAAVLIDMAVGNDDVAVAPGEIDAVAGAADYEAG